MQPQTTNPEQIFFQERTDTFDLKVSLTGDQTLTITLKDFVDWIIYSKEYTEGDIGKEIDRRMDLISVYFAFAQTQPQCDQENMKDAQKEKMLRSRKYQFGSVVENGKLPCYKIERGGKITTYMKMLDMRTQNEVIYNSKLELSKVRDMTELQISSERSTIEKNEIFDELKKEIEKQKMEKSQLLERVILLEEDNTKLRGEFRQMKEQLRATRQQLESLMPPKQEMNPQQKTE